MFSQIFGSTAIVNSPSRHMKLSFHGNDIYIYIYLTCFFFPGAYRGSGSPFLFLSTIDPGRW